MNTARCLVLLMTLVIWPLAGQADSTALQRFMDTVDAFAASFEQTVYDADGDPLQSSSGTVVLERPARFRWEYTNSDSGADGQVLVADGERVWLYDPDLEQVTVNRIDERVAGTPLVVLMGDEPLETGFSVTSLGNAEGIEWFELVPVDESGDFDTVFVGLRGDALAAMELRDNFGQATQLRFDDFDGTIEPEPGLFDFEPPPGVDVIGAD